MRMSRKFLTRLTAAVTVAALVGAARAIVSAANSHHKVLRTFKSALTPAQIQALSNNANQRVIVLLRNQFTKAQLSSRRPRPKLATARPPSPTSSGSSGAPRPHLQLHQRDLGHDVQGGGRPAEDRSRGQGGRA